MSLHPYSREQKLRQIEEFHKNSLSKKTVNSERRKGL